MIRDGTGPVPQPQQTGFIRAEGEIFKGREWCDAEHTPRITPAVSIQIQAGMNSADAHPGRYDESAIIRIPEPDDAGGAEGFGYPMGDAHTNKRIQGVPQTPLTQKRIPHHA